MPAHRKNYDLAVEMYADGLSIQEVADHHSVSRQAMWVILRRRGVQLRPQARYGAENHFFRGGAVRNAVFSLSKYVANGTLKVSPCEVCGLEPEEVNGRQRIHGHHDDYNRLLDVRWLCKEHHDKWHLHNAPIPRSEDWVPTPHSEIARLGGRASQRKKRTQKEDQNHDKTFTSDQ